MAKWTVSILIGLLLWWPITASAQTTNCRFELGFAALAAQLPPQVGTCLDNEQHNPANGDALQHTTNGLLVWRKADNWTAFTDGYRTWLAGPLGPTYRLNSQRFSWEAAQGADALATVMLAVPAQDSPRTATFSPGALTPALYQRITILSTATSGPGPGPVCAFCILAQSAGGLASTLFYAAVPTSSGDVVTVQSGTYRGLDALSFSPKNAGVSYLVVPSGARWLIADIRCPGDPANDVLDGSAMLPCPYL